MADESGVASVDRAFQILDSFGAHDYSLTLAQLAERTGLHKSTILRLSDSLLRAGYLARIPDGSYQVGPKPLQLGAIFQRQFRTVEHVPAILRQIVADLNESASFYIPVGSGRVCLHRVDAPRMIRDAVKEGDWRPLENGAAGTVILAFRGSKKSGMDRVRNEFWASSFGNEVDPELAAVSVPTFGPGGALVGALSISGPRNRIEAVGTSAIVPVLLHYAKTLTAAFGGDIAQSFPQPAH
jgi:DNA-binding IclR family transcriptional regulator